MTDVSGVIILCRLMELRRSLHLMAGYIPEERLARVQIRTSAWDIYGVPPYMSRNWQPILPGTHALQAMRGPTRHPSIPLQWSSLASPIGCRMENCMRAQITLNVSQCFAASILYPS